MSTTQIIPVPPTALLKAVHDKIRELFDRYDALGPEAGWARKGLSEVIQDILRSHMEIEEALFYPVVQNLESELSVRVVVQALRDHQQAKTLLEELKTLSSESRELDLKMAELQECIFSHLNLEEGEVFPHARAMSPDALGRLSVEMEKLKERLRDAP